MGKLSLSSWRATDPPVPWKTDRFSVTSNSRNLGQVNECPKPEKEEHAEHVEDVVEIYPSPPALGEQSKDDIGRAESQEDDAVQPWPFQPKRLPDEQLPLIPATRVKKRDGKIDENGKENRLWIVVNNVVLDVTEYVFKHPGGRAIISGFGGQDCTWQWYSFHNADIWRSIAAGLRVGRTEGVENVFQKPKTIIGLRGHGFQDWD